jgi:hypothetical protein
LPQAAFPSLAPSLTPQAPPPKPSPPQEREPSSASIPILERYIAQRVEERKLARAKLTAAVHAAIDLFEWNKVHLAIVREKRAASVDAAAPTLHPTPYSLARARTPYTLTLALTP